MAQLYSWFLNATRLGIPLTDAYVRASLRFAWANARQLWSAAYAAFSARSLAGAMSLSPLSSMQGVLTGVRPISPVPGTIYGTEELLGMYTQLNSPPYSVKVILGEESDATGSIVTLTANTNPSLSWQQIMDRIDQQARWLRYDENPQFRELRIGWVLGNPVLIEDN